MVGIWTIFTRLVCGQLKLLGGMVKPRWVEGLVSYSGAPPRVGGGAKTAHLLLLYKLLGRSLYEGGGFSPS